MAPLIKLEELMNLSLETKLAIYENMLEHVGQRPVIFTSRAEIWSTDTNPVIIFGHLFPSGSPSENTEPIDLTREMMEYYQDLNPHDQEEEKIFHLILFQFQVGGSTEVHAVFSRSENNAKDNPTEIYLKHLEPTEVLIRECSTESNSGKTLKTSVSMVLAGEISFARPAPISGSKRSAIVRKISDDDEVRDIGPIESRLGPEVCNNLEEKVGLFQEEITSGVEGVMFTNVAGLWNTRIEWKCIKHPIPRIILADYDHNRFDVEEDIFEYIRHAAKQYIEPFDVYSRKFGDGQFADVHLMFTVSNAYESQSSQDNPYTPY